MASTATLRFTFAPCTKTGRVTVVAPVTRVNVSVPAPSRPTVITSSIAVPSNIRSALTFETVPVIEPCGTSSVKSFEPVPPSRLPLITATAFTATKKSSSPAPPSTFPFTLASMSKRSAPAPPSMLPSSVALMSNVSLPSAPFRFSMLENVTSGLAAVRAFSRVPALGVPGAILKVSASSDPVSTSASAPPFSRPLSVPPLCTVKLSAPPRPSSDSTFRYVAVTVPTCTVPSFPAVSVKRSAPSLASIASAPVLPAPSIVPLNRPFVSKRNMSSWLPPVRFSTWLNVAPRPIN